MANSKKIIKPGYNCLTVADAHASGVIIDASNYYRAFHDAAKNAKKTILISGWQFDSSVRLLRADGKEVVFLNFLKELCDVNRELKIRILAWDFSIIYMLSREWRQRKKFIEAHPQIAFHFDGRHALVASRHQKYVVIDSSVAFVGGMDICERRWDDRFHAPENPLRVGPDGVAYDPYHDVQTVHAGSAALALAQLFAKRWSAVAKEELDTSPPANEGAPFNIKPDFLVPCAKVAISRTEARSIRGKRKPIKEIKRLYIEAILHAEKLIYIENQYFTSFAIYRALLRKMKSAPGGLQIIIVLPKREQTALERIYVGISQHRLLNSLVRVAKRYRQRIGIYHPVAYKDKTRVPVFIHSKVMAIDNSFLTIGSANTSNRSMGLDSELNVSWEADTRGDERFFRTVDDIRSSLLAEHAGVLGSPDAEALSGTNNLVDRLDAMADLPGGRLQRRKSMKQSLFSWLLNWLNLDKIIIDPENAIIDDDISGLITAYNKSGPRRVLEYVAGLLGISRKKESGRKKK